MSNVATKQREAVNEREQIAGTILKATAMGVNWFDLVTDSGASLTSSPFKSGFVESHPSNGLVMDEIDEC